jgi:hypothetical protein
MAVNAGPKWLLLLHQIPRKPEYLRVKVWRRLQRLGAVAIRNALYALPRSEERNEDLQWVMREIVSGGGEATLVEANLVQGLRDDQVLDNGLEVTALHNHFFWDSPKVMFMHIGGMGEQAKLAAAVGKVFAKVEETGVAPRAEIDPARTSLDPAKIESVLGHKGELRGGVYKVVIGRTAKIGAHAVGKTMGVNTWAAFAGSDDKAVVDCDFAMLETELQGVLKALRGAGIDVVAIHQHMTGEQPRVMFLHYCQRLEKGGAAIDLTQEPLCDLDGFLRNDPANGCTPSAGLADCNDDDAGVFPGATMGARPAWARSARSPRRCAATAGTFYEPTGTTGTARIGPAGTVGDADCNCVPYQGGPMPCCDADGDGYPNSNAGCNPGGGPVDCNDGDPTIFSGAPDKCGNSILENCTADTACGGQDQDGDGYAAQYDCNDNNAAIHPFARELCNGVDDDCDGLKDEGNPDGAGAPLVSAGAITGCTTSNVGQCGKGRGKCLCSSAANNPKEAPVRMFCPTETAGGSKPPRCYGSPQPRPQSCDACAPPRDDDCDGFNDARWARVAR